MKKYLLPLLFLFPLLCNGQDQSPSQENTPPCLQPEHENISFLIGDWDVVSRQRVNFSEDRWNESNGKASWSAILGGCALREEWSGKMDGQDMKWIQILTYNQREDKWEQVMIDWAHGNLITTDGYFEYGKLIFTAPQMRNGELLIDRTTFEKVNNNRFFLSMETSLDGGKSWITFWEMKYTKQ